MPRLSVIMPFGVRELPADGAHLDFDAVYHDLIRPAAQEAGWEPLRIDELAQPGVITDQYLRELYAADLVLADVSMPNGNVYYELGVRQAISAAGTLLVALEGTELPFDLSTQRVLFYSGDFSRESGPRRQLAAALRSFDPTTTTTTTTTTNPVRTFLERMGLTSSPRHDDAAFEQDLNGRINRARNADQLVAVWHWAKAFRPLPASALLVLADHLAEYRVYATAADVLRAAVRTAPEDYEVHRKLGFYLRQLGPEHEQAAMEHLSRARELNPDDPETLGMIGGLLKRQGRYVDAHQLYELGAKLSPTNLYMRVNQACMAVLADVRSPQRGVELYQQLLTLIASWRPTETGPSAPTTFGLANVLRQVVHARPAPWQDAPIEIISALRHPVYIAAYLDALVQLEARLEADAGPALAHAAVFVARARGHRRPCRSLRMIWARRLAPSGAQCDPRRSCCFVACGGKPMTSVTPSRPLGRWSRRPCVTAPTRHTPASVTRWMAR